MRWKLVSEGYPSSRGEVFSVCEICLFSVTVLRAVKAHYFSGGMKGDFHFENTIVLCISVHGMI